MKHWQNTILLALASIPLSAHSDAYTCVSLDYPPLIQKGETGESTGLAVEIVSTVFQQMGHTVKVEIYPWARSLAMVKDGERDCVFTIYRSPEREQFLDFSNESIAPQVVYFYARKDSKISFNGDFEALRTLRIGTVHKINYGPKFEHARTYLTIDVSATLEQNFKKLAIGRIDLLPSNVYTAAATLDLPGLWEFADKLVKLPVPIESVPSYIAFSKSRKLTALRNSFDTEFRKFIASSAYRRLLEKYRIDTVPELARYLEPKTEPK